MEFIKENLDIILYVVLLVGSIGLGVLVSIFRLYFDTYLAYRLNKNNPTESRSEDILRSTKWLRSEFKFASIIFLKQGEDQFINEPKEYVSLSRWTRFAVAILTLMVFILYLYSNEQKEVVMILSLLPILNFIWWLTLSFVDVVNINHYYNKEHVIKRITKRYDDNGLSSGLNKYKNLYFITLLLLSIISICINL